MKRIFEKRFRHYLIYAGTLLACAFMAWFFDMNYTLLVACTALAFAVDKDRAIISVQPKQLSIPMLKKSPTHYVCELGEILQKDDGWHVHFFPAKAGYGPYGTQDEAVAMFSKLAMAYITEGEKS